MDKIKFGKRYTIYSPKDRQHCLDHDGSEGQGINPQEYTAIKLKAIEWTVAAVKSFRYVAKSAVYFVATTLRLEKMYGQASWFVGTKLVYRVQKLSNNEHIIVTKRAARNMAFQGIFSTQCVYEKVAEVPGTDHVGTLVNAPLSVHHTVRILPMEPVKATKGTGVVTSVPSDSPDDYATVISLAKKADYHGIDRQWAELEITPIIDAQVWKTRRPYSLASHEDYFS